MVKNNIESTNLQSGNTAYLNCEDLNLFFLFFRHTVKLFATLDEQKLHSEFSDLHHLEHPAD